MRHSPAFRILTALLGVLVLVNLAQPTGMSGMDMRGMEMPGMSKMDMSDMLAAEMSADEAAAHCAEMAAEAARAEAPSMHHGAQDEPSQAPAKSHDECLQHECCTSALVHVSLAPIAALSWLPVHVISQDTPEGNNGVVNSDGQLLLPFANAPPQTVYA